MPNEDHYRKLENMYHTAPCNVYYQPKMAITEGRAEIAIKVKEDFFHAGQAVHGSVYFKMLDDAAWFSANSLEEEVFILTVSFNTFLIRPVTVGEMRAVGAVVTATRSIFIAESVIYDSENREVARGRGNFVKSKQSLNSISTYSL